MKKRNKEKSVRQATKELRVSEAKRVGKLKSKIFYAQRVYFNPELTRADVSFRVGHICGYIEADPKKFNKYPKEFRYFLIRWAKHCRKHSKESGHLVVADTLATGDYLKKGYSTKLLLRYFFEMLFDKSGQMGRILSMNMNLYSLGKWKRFQ